MDNGKKKLVITEEHFQRVTQALVMRLRQHEESVKKDGTTWIHLLALLTQLYTCMFILATVQVKTYTCLMKERDDCDR